jgi:DNA-binding transcriptional MerR regulator
METEAAMIMNGIGAVSVETGFSKSSLRRYESLGLISPGRLDFGEVWVRVYSDRDVQLLKRVRTLMDSGYQLRAAFEKAGQELD